MELKITHMIKDCDTMPLLSGSVCELGDNAGEITWGNSKDYAHTYPLLKTPEELQEAKDYFRSFGAWDDDEIASWSDRDVQALVVQEIAANIRELEHYDTEEEYFLAAENGRCSGLLFKSGEDWYAYIGN